MDKAKLSQREYSRVYGMGYNAGRGNSWPDHKPPLPPNSIIANLLTALRELRDEADSVCATFGPDDPVSKQFDAKIEAADRALKSVSEWLAAQEPTP